ncbi:MAG TPA: carboxymuconolactone decarboxylase family protein [Burkholderiales bacterium]|nr:carboxymuconolactone decarboxylase family protein [Burkholderiales bacterium]
MSHVERMPLLDPAAMNDAQRTAAQALAAGPRGGVKGPFIALLRSPELMDRLQQVGEYLRFHSALEPRISEFLMLVVSRAWTQQFEWAVHAPLALKAGVAPQAVDSLAEGRRPEGMAKDEALAYDFCDELLRTKGVSDATYRAAMDQFGERGVIDTLGVIGYFTTVSMVLNVAHTPAQGGTNVAPLRPLPM